MPRCELSVSRYSRTTTTSRPRVPSGRIWPNGEFGIGWAADPRTEDVFDGGAAWREGHLHPLGLTNTSNSHKPVRSPRGQGGITSYGRRMVRNAAFVMQAEASKDRLSFLTLTIPPLTPEEEYCLGRNWAEIVRVFCQWLRRKLGAASLPGEIVQVTELQSQRHKERGGLPLHLHMVFVGRLRRGSWAVTPKQVRSAWRRSCTRFAGSTADWSNSENLVRVRKDAGSYLSKYLSKGSGAVSNLLDTVPPGSIPSSWYGVSRSLARRVKAQTLTSEAACTWVMALCEDATCGVFHYVYPLRLEFDDGGGYIAGYAGKLQSSALSEISSAVRAALSEISPALRAGLSMAA